MTVNGRQVRIGARRRSIRRQAPGAIPGAGALLRSVLLGAAVFALAALTGALLSGAATRESPGPRPDPTVAGPTAAQPAEPALDTGFADSLIWSGAAGLGLSIGGLVMVTRRRRRW